MLTIGNFDGLHVGHASIMETVTHHAESLGGEAVVLTFDPHPRKVLTPERAPKLLCTEEQKLELLEASGVDVTIVEPFDREYASRAPDSFVRETIHQRIGPEHVYVGYDFHFGRDREGSMRLLTETGPRLGFAVTIIPEVTVRGRDVNSTRIRELLESGDVAEVSTLLGRPFAVRGAVVEGQRRGRELGFPTANLRTENEVLPAAGVYAGVIRLLGDGEPAEGTRLRAVTNVGLRPTFEDGRGLVAEAHVLDFDGDLYGRQVELDFRVRLRGEERFDGVDALRSQISRDVEKARKELGEPA